MEPYTYLIGWKNLNIWYYGVRYSKNCHPSDLWTKYFTSSKTIKTLRSEIGEPDIIQIRKTFEDVNSARLWENKVLRRLNVINSSKWINKTNNISFSVEASISGSIAAANIKRGKTHSEDHKKRISEGLKGKKRDPEIFRKVAETKSKKKMEDPNYTGGSKKGRVFSQEHREKLSLAKKNKPGRMQSEEERNKRSMTMKGNKNGLRKILG